MPKKQDLLNLFHRQNGYCYLCGELLTKFELEHKVPLSRGGTNDPENLALACQSCNRIKGSKTLTEFVRYISEHPVHRVVLYPKVVAKLSD